MNGIEPWPSATEACDGVLLLHGIAGRAASLRPMERRLADAGYATLNLDYPARALGLSEIVERIAPNGRGVRGRRRAASSRQTRTGGDAGAAERGSEVADPLQRFAP